jgi:hypothetical protein
MTCSLVLSVACTPGTPVESVAAPLHGVAISPTATLPTSVRPNAQSSALYRAQAALSVPVTEFLVFGMPGMREPTDDELARCAKNERAGLPLQLAIVYGASDGLFFGTQRIGALSDFSGASSASMASATKRRLSLATRNVKQVNLRAAAAGCVVRPAGLAFLIALDHQAPATLVDLLATSLAVAGSVQELAFVVDDESEVGLPPREHSGTQSVHVELADDGFHALAWQTIVRNRIAATTDEGVALLAPARFSWVSAKVNASLASHDLLHLLDAIRASGMPCVELTPSLDYVSVADSKPVISDRASLAVIEQREQVKILPAVIGDTTQTLAGKCKGHTRLPKTKADAVIQP